MQLSTTLESDWKTEMGLVRAAIPQKAMSSSEKAAETRAASPGEPAAASLPAQALLLGTNEQVPLRAERRRRSPAWQRPVARHA
jgi:hypothetical protein